MGTYFLLIKIQEIDAPLYFSEYNLTIKIDYPGGLSDSNFTTNSSLLVGTLNGDKMKTEQKLTVKFNHKIQKPPQGYDVIKD